MKLLAKMKFLNNKFNKHNNKINKINYNNRFYIFQIVNVQGYENSVFLIHLNNNIMSLQKLVNLKINQKKQLNF